MAPRTATPPPITVAPSRANTAQWMANARRLELRARRSTSSDLAGCYRSAFRGTGVTFHELREYQVGDDVKHIHWKASVRSERVYVKSYVEERQLSVLLAVDVSASAGSALGTRSYEHMLEVAGLLAATACAQRDAVGLCLFSKRIEHLSPPSSARRSLTRLLTTLCAPRTLSRATNIAAVCSELRERVRRRSIVFLLSDFASPPFDDELTFLAARHEVVCVAFPMVVSMLPPAGIVEFVDAESGAHVVLDLASPGSLEQLRQAEVRRLQAVSRSCLKAGADWLTITEQPVRELQQFLQRRAMRAR